VLKEEEEKEEDVRGLRKLVCVKKTYNAMPISVADTRD